MGRRKHFDPMVIAPSFWQEDIVRTALARRDMTALLQAFFAEHPQCTQTRLAVLINHDRADVSNWVRGVRQQYVNDIDVLTRIADGLAMPDHARVMLGLAPAEARFSTFDQPPSPATHTDTPGAAPDGLLTVAICGSHATGTNSRLIDETIVGLARTVMVQDWNVSHGPVGVGIAVMTYIADHYQPPEVPAAMGRFGRRNVVAPASHVIVLGGGHGTADETYIAESMHKKILAFPATGGTAHQFFGRATRDPGLRAWIPDDTFTALGECDSAAEFIAHLTMWITHQEEAP